jgi:DNA mismatch endonuclease, patch repair protein
MSRIRGRDTKPEMIVRRLLHAAGYRFRLHRRDLPGRPDLVFPVRQKIIFVHGCYWHRHDCPYGRVSARTNAAFWDAKIRGNVERDRRDITALEAAGWRVHVVWECETKAISILARRLERFLGRREKS